MLWEQCEHNAKGSVTRVSDVLATTVTKSLESAFALAVTPG